MGGDSPQGEGRTQTPGPSLGSHWVLGSSSHGSGDWEGARRDGIAGRQVRRAGREGRRKVGREGALGSLGPSLQPSWGSHWTLPFSPIAVTSPFNLQPLL